jgi:hypothetical protein
VKAGRSAGRPPLPVGEAKGVVVACRLTEAERDEVAAAAELDGMTVAQWARKALVDCARVSAARARALSR